MVIDPQDPRTWPDNTIVVRGGIGEADRLQEIYEGERSFSVQADPLATFTELCRALPHGFVR
jgi:hypothetical protein